MIPKRAFALIGLTIVFLISMSSCGQQSKSAGANSPQPTVSADLKPTLYVDPNGYFKILPPSGWRIQTYPNDSRGKVAFFGPENRVSLRVLVKAVPEADYDEQFQLAQSLEAESGIPMHVEKVSFNDIPAIKRVASIRQQGVKMKYMMIDLRIRGINNNLQYGAPENLFDKHSNTVWLSMLSYVSLKTETQSSLEEIRRHETAKWIRMARIALEMGKKQSAKEFVSIGLEGEPENAELQELLSVLEKR